MKHIFTILLVGLSLFSCKEDDDVVTITISAEDFEITLDENPTIGQELGSITATTNSGEVAFEIVSQDPADAFSIVAGTGAIAVSNVTAFDFERNSTVTGVVKVMNEGISEIVNVLITLNDLDDAVVTILNFDLSIEENPVAKQVLGTVEATSDQGAITFSVQWQDPEGAFSIDADTGELRVADVELFDFELNEVITGIVWASSANVTVEGTVTITLIDLQEITVTTSDLEVSVDENPIPNQVLGTVEGETNNGAVTFSVVSQVPDGAFSINEETGVLSVLDETIFDYEINQIITGIVLVENGTVSANANITINVNDVHECIESNLLFQQELMDYADGDTNLNLDYTLDLTTHEYTFTPNSNLTLCSIGYQAYDETPYLMEIENGTGTILYSELMVFSSTEQDEVLLSTPLDLIAGESYTVRRIQNDYTFISEVIGFIILTQDFSQINFPVNFNEITIMASDFYGTGGPIPNVGIPYITLGFE